MKLDEIEARPEKNKSREKVKSAGDKSDTNATNLDSNDIESLTDGASFIRLFYYWLLRPTTWVFCHYLSRAT